VKLALVELKLGLYLNDKLQVMHVADGIVR
jgi:hypothetical protein